MIRGMPINRWLVWAGLFLLVVGAKLWLVSVAGSSLPYRDQIDAEGEAVLRPWAEDRLEWEAFFTPHNEHRIVFTKLIAWGVVALNGQWDAYVQVTLNALIHAALLIVFLNWMRQQIRDWRFFVLALVGVGLWILPFDWENTLQGFQSQVYLVLLFSFLHLRGVLGASRMNLKWGLGQVCGLMALGAMAGGSFSSTAIILVLAVRGWRKRVLSRFDIVTILLCTGWVLIGLFTHNSVPGHASFRAQNLAELMSAIGEIMAWPVRGGLPWSVLFGLPAIVTAAALLWRTDISVFDRTYLGVVLWLLITLLATAVFRGHGSPLISRYLTNYALLVLVQGMVWTFLRPSKVTHTGLVLWAVLILAALATSLKPTWKHILVHREEEMQQQERTLRDYFTTGNPRPILEAPASTLPYPSGPVLIERWRYPSIQNLMPAAVRAPAVIASETNPETVQLPPSEYPLLTVSPTQRQTEPWLWQSERQSADSQRFLRFKINGGLGDPESALSMRLVSDTESVDVIPEGSARNRWRTINVFRPAGEWWIELEDNDSLEHIALTAPVELGAISWAVEKAIKYHLWWLSLGAVLLLAGGLISLTPVTLRQASPRE